MPLRDTAAIREVRTNWPDTRLVHECLRGSDKAWSALIDKYKNLIFSIPIKYGFSSDDSTDIFQSVCLELLSALPRLRKPKALPKWIMQVTAHQCFHRWRQQQRLESSDSEDPAAELGTEPRAERLLQEAEEEHALREAISGLPPRCQELVRMLFFEEPAREYREVAASLGIAVGSIGFIRQRCLEKLRRRLIEIGF